jgi:hypothetical protein
MSPLPGLGQTRWDLSPRLTPWARICRPSADGLKRTRGDPCHVWLRPNAVLCALWQLFFRAEVKW